MPISVTCPECSARMKAPDTAAGKRVKCPKCNAPIPVVADARAEAVSPKPAAAAKKPAPPPLEDDYEEPRRKRRSAADEIEEAPPRRRSRGDEIEEAPRAARRQRDDDLDEHDSDEEVGGINIPPALEDKVMEELSKGEKIVWAGQPAPRILRWNAMMAMIGGCVLALVGVGFGLIFLFALAREANLWWVGVLIMVIFGGGGVATAIWGPMWVHLMGKKTAYIITNRRAIVWTPAFFGEGKVDNYTPVQLQHMDRRDSWWFKGAGDLVFATQTEYSVSHSRTGSTVNKRVIRFGFLNVDNVRKIEKILRETLIDKLLDKYTM